MSKDVKKIFIVSFIFIALILVYFVVTKINKEKPTVTPDNKQTETKYFKDKLNITKVKVSSKEGDFTFNLDSSTLKWSLDSDSNFKVDSDIINNLISNFNTLTYFRQVDNDPSEFGLDKDYLLVTIIDNNNVSHSFKFTDKLLDDKTSYFMSLDDNKIYTSNTSIYYVGQYKLSDYYKVATIPAFTSNKLDNILISNSSGEYHISAEDKKYFYYCSTNNETDSNHQVEVIQNDASVLNNFLNEIKYNYVYKIAPSDADLATYGLDKPSACLNIVYYGQGTGVNSSANTKFEYTIDFGNLAKENDGEYYVRFFCIEDGEESKLYSDSSVFTLNSIYAKYFIKFTEDRLNGLYQIKNKYLPEDALPIIKKDEISELIIANYSKDNKKQIRIVNQENIYKVTELNNPNAEDFETNEAAKNQLFAYLTQKELFALGDIVALKDDNTINNYINFDKDDYVLFSINFDVDNDGQKVSMTSNLYIGNEAKDEDGHVIGYYATTNNSDHIMIINIEIGDYIKFLSIPYFKGEEKYNSLSE